MIKLIEKLKGAILVYEDSETNEIYYQCMCGGIGMYERCLKLNEDEIQEYRSGKMDHDNMLRSICSKSQGIANRLVKPF